MNADVASIIMNYGIAGIILYVFYKLVSNELAKVKESVDKLALKIERLITLIEEKVR